VSVFHAAYAAPGMMKMGLISGKSGIGAWCRVGGRLKNGASSPRVSLARMSLRTRYCCPRLSGSTRSRMSPQRHPPALVSRGDCHGHRLRQGSRIGRASQVHHCRHTLPSRNRETLRRGPDLRNYDQGPHGVSRLPGRAGCDPCGYGIDRRALEAGLEHFGWPVQAFAGEPSPGQAGTRP
jgi:hypothetical protein